ncbi:MAG TPA: cyclic nucleotide-binding domain-containing protein [Syntrophobacter fumaroxidans]|nr:cyclic nucleotide-binding domain-containing protein [Syntrophobacter fumaroxidans]
MTEYEIENIDSLSKSPLFRDIPKDRLAEIARSAQNRIVPQHDFLIRQGDAADVFYVIASGRVRVTKKNERGMERELGFLGPGDNFGEIALLTGEPRAADVVALEETRCMVFSKEQFDALLTEFPYIYTKFVKEMRQWLLKDDEVIFEEAEEAYQASRLSWYQFVLIIAVSVVLALSFNRSNPNGIPLFPSMPDRNAFPAVTASTAMEELERGDALVVDALPSNFYQKRHIKNAINMPLALFDIVYTMTFDEEDRARKIVVYGTTISKPYDLEVAEKLAARGHTNVSILNGGLAEWEAKGYPVEGKAKE